MNDFARSSLSIAPAAKLMSAKAFVNPDEVYGQGNEWIRLAESLKGISAQGDKLADEFIEKQKSKAKAQAEKDLLNMMRTGDKNVEEYLKEQKRQVSKFNTLGTSFWTREYLAKGQAENLLAKKKAMLEQDYINKGYANLSVEEYNKRLAEDVLNFDKDLENYDEDTRHYYESMPNKELFAIMQERHIRNVNEKNLVARNNIFANNMYGLMTNGELGALSVELGMPDEKTYVMTYKELTPEKQAEIKRQATSLSKVLGGVSIEVDANGNIIDTDVLNDYGAMVMAIENSELYKMGRGFMIEGARIGMSSSVMQEKLFEACNNAIEKGEDSEMVAALYVTLLDKMNFDTEFNKELGEWRFNQNDIPDTQDAVISSFDMGDAEAKAQMLKSKGDEVKAREIRRAEIDEHLERKKQDEFLDYVVRSNLVAKDEWLTLDKFQIAKKLKVDYNTYAEAIDKYQKRMVEGFDIQYSDGHKEQYNKALRGIVTGVITDKREIFALADRKLIHVNDVDKLLNKFEEEGGIGAEQRMQKVRTIMTRVYKDVEAAVTEGSISEREASAYLGQLELEVLEGVKNGKYDIDKKSITDVWDMHIAIGIASKGEALFAGNKSDRTTLQLPQDFNQSIVAQNTQVSVDEKGITQPIYYIGSNATYEDFLNSPLGKNLVRTSLTEEQKRELYEIAKGNSDVRDKQQWNEFVTGKVKSKDISEADLADMYDKDKEGLEKALGFKVIMLEGRVVPEDEKERANYIKSLQQGKSVYDIIKPLKRYHNYIDRLKPGGVL